MSTDETKQCADRLLAAIQSSNRSQIQEIIEAELSGQASQFSTIVYNAALVPRNEEILDLLLNTYGMTRNTTMKVDLYQSQFLSAKQYRFMHHFICKTMDKYPGHDLETPLIAACRHGYWKNAFILYMYAKETDHTDLAWSFLDYIIKYDALTKFDAYDDDPKKLPPTLNLSRFLIYLSDKYSTLLQLRKFVYYMKRWCPNSNEVDLEPFYFHLLSTNRVHHFKKTTAYFSEVPLFLKHALPWSLVHVVLDHMEEDEKYGTDMLECILSVDEAQRKQASYGCRLVDLLDDKGMSPLMYAATKSNMAAMKILIYYGATLDDEITNYCNDNGLVEFLNEVYDAQP